MKLNEAIQLEGIENDQSQRMKASQAINTIYRHIESFGLFGFYMEREERFSNSLISIKSNDIFDYRGIPFTFSFYSKRDNPNYGLYISSDRRIAINIMSDQAYMDCVDALADRENISKDTISTILRTKKTAFHEYIHFLDDVNGGGWFNKVPSSGNMNYKDHTNSDMEVNTRMQEMVFEFEEEARKVRRSYNDAYRKLQSEYNDPEIIEILLMDHPSYQMKSYIESLSKSFDNWLRYIKQLSPSVWDNLERDRQRNVINRLYKYWDMSVKNRNISTMKLSKTNYH